MDGAQSGAKAEGFKETTTTAGMGGCSSGIKMLGGRVRRGSRAAEERGHDGLLSNSLARPIKEEILAKVVL